MIDLRQILCISICFFGVAFQTHAQQNAVPIRAGAHPTYSRLVIPTANDLAWELRTFGREATLMFPTVDITFLTDRVFDRLPRTRILNLSTEVTAGETFLTLRLACDCDVSANIEGTNLILDVNDQKSPEPVFETETETDAESETANDETIAPPAARPQTDTPTTASVTPSNLAERLISQLNKAAEQGIIELNEEPEQKKDNPSLETANTEIMEPAELNPEPPMNQLQPIEENLDGLEAVAERMRQELEDAPQLSDLGDSVRITIPEEFLLPESNKPNRKKPVEVVEAEPDPLEHCVEDAFLDVAYWADTRPYSVQAAELKSRVFGEFDEADDEAVLELARFFIFFGLGTEATSLLKDLQLDEYQSEILLELANTVEGNQPISGGVLEKAAGCEGLVTLWRTAALDMSEAQPIADTDSLIDFFSQLPIEVRRMIGPRLVQSFITRGQRTAANRIFAIVERAPGYHGSEHELKRAVLRYLDGDAEAAEQIYWRLVYERSDVAAKAADALVKSMLERGAPIPPNALSVLEALAFEFRGSQQGKDLLLTVIKAKAGSNALSDAIDISLQEIRHNPAVALEYYDAIDAIFKNASTAEVGTIDYLDIVFENMDIIRGENVSDTTKNTIAQEVINSGLPNAAIEILESITQPNPSENNTMSAEIAWKLRQPEIVLALHDQQPDNSVIARLASLAHSSLGQHQEAIEAVQTVVDLQDNSSLAWRAGDWQNAEVSPSDRIRLLAGFMNGRNSETLSDAEIDLSRPLDAIARRLPLEEEVTLKYVKDVEQQSATIRQFLKDTLAEM